jgi:hypothetical protein
VLIQLGHSLVRLITGLDFPIGDFIQDQKYIGKYLPKKLSYFPSTYQANLLHAAERYAKKTINIPN